jgi:spore maturation protein SpmB
MNAVSAVAPRLELALVCLTRPRQVVPCCFALRAMSVAAAVGAAAHFVPIHLLDSHVCRIHNVCSGASRWPLVVKFV